MKAAKNTKKVAGFVGLGFDAPDEHKRLTRGKNFLLAGGSAETHAVMQETAIKINENLDRRGKRLEDVSPREFADILRHVTDR